MKKLIFISLLLAACTYIFGQPSLIWEAQLDTGGQILSSYAKTTNGFAISYRFFNEPTSTFAVILYDNDAQIKLIRKFFLATGWISNHNLASNGNDEFIAVFGDSIYIFNQDGLLKQGQIGCGENKAPAVYVDSYTGKYYVAESNNQLDSANVFMLDENLNLEQIYRIKGCIEDIPLCLY